MADNVTSKDASGATITLATDEVSSVHVSRFKIVPGADGLSEGDVSKSNGMPIQESCPASKIAVKTVAFGTWTGSFADLALGTLTNVRRIKIVNDSNGTFALSEDAGSTTHEVVPAGASGYMKTLAGTTAIYGKYLVAPTVGNVYFTPEF